MSTPAHFCFKLEKFHIIRGVNLKENLVYVYLIYKKLGFSKTEFRIFF